MVDPVSPPVAGPSRQPSYRDLYTLRPEIIIVGAGIAGTALAYSLSKTRSVVLLERDLSEPDRIVGELLQPGGVAALTQLGLGGCLDGIDATPVEGYCVVSGERRVGIPYPELERMIGESEEFGGGEGVSQEEASEGLGKKRDGKRRLVDDDGEELLDGVVGGQRATSADGDSKSTTGENGRADGNGHTNGYSYATRNGYASGHSDGLANGFTNGHTNGCTNGHANGHANSYPNAGRNGPSNGHNPLGDRKPPSAGSIPHVLPLPPSPLSPEWHVPSLSGKKEGRSFHHGRLITSLRHACLEAGPELVVLEATVRDLLYCEHTSRVIGVSAAFKSPPVPPSTEPSVSVRNIHAPLVIVADGCFSKFRTSPGVRVPPTRTRSHFVGVVVKDLDLPMKRHGTVCLTPEGPVLLYQIGNEAEETRMLVDVKGKLPSVSDGSLRGGEVAPADMQSYIETKYLPHLPTTLHTPILDALASQRLRTMPNSFLPPLMQGRHSSPQGLILVGDAWNMRHPLTGGGMTVAFNDAVLLTEYLSVERLGRGRIGLEDWNQVAVGLREWFWKRKELAGVINVLSMALYDLFGGAEEPDLEVLREGCFRYFELGGDRVAGPVGLLSAITPKPLLLFYHFFSVAFYSIWILITWGRPPPPGEKAQKPSWVEVPGLALFSVKVFYTACVVLLPMIITEFRI